MSAWPTRPAPRCRSSPRPAPSSRCCWRTGSTSNDKLTGRRILGCLARFCRRRRGEPVGRRLRLAPDAARARASSSSRRCCSRSAAIYGKRLSADMDAGRHDRLATAARRADADGLPALPAAVTSPASGSKRLGCCSISRHSRRPPSRCGALLLKHNPVGTVAIFNCAIPIFGVLLVGAVPRGDRSSSGRTSRRWCW